MKVHFAHGQRNLGLHDLEGVPREGERVTLSREGPLYVWSVDWLVGTAGGTFADVALMTDQEYSRASNRRITGACPTCQA
jgi:hypothetical protein